MSPEVLVWWRDDDAGRHDPRLDMLLDLARDSGHPLALAVVPAWLDSTTTNRVLAVPNVHVMQHGWAHADHARPGAKAIELGGSVDSATCCHALRQGATRLRSTFGERFQPVMVPPWNRIDAHCLEALPGLGFSGLSTFADDRRGTAFGLVQVNAHVDLIDWRGTRRMKPLARLMEEVDSLLAEPDRRVIGLLSHHLEMSLDDVARMGQLLAHVDRLGRCRWADLPRLFLER